MNETRNGAPRTEAGRRLLDSWRLVDEHGPPNAHVIRDAILAIEQEAARPVPEPQPDLSLNGLRAAIEEELAMVGDKPDPFDSGAAAAYNFVLSLMPSQPPDPATAHEVKR